MAISYIGTDSISGLGYGFKNRIINGAMQVYQRGGYSGALSGGVAQYGGPDRWFVGVGSGTTTLTSTQVATGLPNTPYCLAVQRSAGQTNTAALYASQQIESKNLDGLRGQTVSISFTAACGANFSPTSGTVQVYVATGTGTDQAAWGGLNGAWTGWAIQAVKTFNATGSWTQYTCTAMIPSGANELQLTFAWTPTGTAGAADTFYVTGVQLELGSTATSFDYRPYGTELQLCQRYYWKISAAAGSVDLCSAMLNSSTAAYGVVLYPQVMRVASAVATNATTTVRVVWSAGTSVTSAFAVDRYSTTSSLVRLVTTGLTTGQGAWYIVDSGASNYIEASAEL